MKTFYFIISLTFFSTFVNAQNYLDSVLMLNGKSYVCNVIGTEGTSLHFQVENKKGLAEDYYMANYRIFSYHQNNTETVLYAKNGVR